MYICKHEDIFTGHSWTFTRDMVALDLRYQAFADINKLQHSRKVPH